MGNCLSLSEDPDMHIWSWVDANIDIAECDRCHRCSVKTWKSLSSREKSKDWRVIVLQQSDATLARGVSGSVADATGVEHGNRIHKPGTSSPQRGSLSLSPPGSPGGNTQDALKPLQSTPFLIMCTPCSEAYQKEMEQFKKERQYYANAKGMLYPKQRLRTVLRRIQTGEGWENTESFHATYRPNSVLEGLGEEDGGGSIEDVDSMLRGETDITLVEEDTIEYEILDEEVEMEEEEQDDETDKQDNGARP